MSHLEADNYETHICLHLELVICHNTALKLHGLEDDLPGKFQVNYPIQNFEPLAI